MQNAAAYIRVSTDDQTEFSPDAQLNAIKEYAKRNNYIITEVYKDEGISGLKAEKRPGFMRMIGTAKQKVFDAIIVHKMDRFSRSREDSVVYKSLLRKECGVKVISVTENFEDDKFGILIEAMLEAMAEYYSLNLSDEVLKGMTEKAKRGGLQATPSYGYAVQENVLVPIPAEAEIIVDIFKRFNNGDGYITIAKSLNKQGIRTRRGNAFDNRAIEYIIRNPVYIGKLRWTPTGRVCRKYNNEDTLTAEGQHEAIIDTETWETAQKRVLDIKAKWRPYARPPEEHKDWLSGLIRCSTCGRTIIRSGVHGWRCNGYVHGQCVTSQTVSDDQIKALFIEGLKQSLKSKKPLSYLDVKVDPTKPAHEDFQKQINAIERRISRIKDAYYNEAITLEEFKTDRQNLEKSKRIIEKQLDDAIHAHAEDKSPEIKKGVKEIIKMLESKSSTTKEKYDIVHAGIKEAVYNKEKNTLKLVFMG